MTFAFRPDDSAAAAPAHGRGALDRQIRASLRALRRERLKPALLAGSAPALALAILTLSGVTLALPAFARLGLSLAALCVGVALFVLTLRRVRRPDRRDAILRLERDNALAHAPIATLEDAPFGAEAEHPLWRAHVAAARLSTQSLSASPARATFDSVDPYALRHAALGLLAVALVVAGPERGARMAALWTPGAAGAGAGGSGVEVWIEPPAYTGLSPIRLARGEDKLAGLKTQVDAPEGSRVVAQGPPGVVIAFRTPKGETARKRSGPPAPSLFETVFGLRRNGTAEDVAADGALSFVLSESGVLTVSAGHGDARWPVGIRKDAAPAVAFSGSVREENGKLVLPILFLDDYGAVEARLSLRLDPKQARPLDAPPLDPQAIREERTLVVAGAAGKPGARRLVADVSAEPWAGMDVFAKVVIVDGKGQTGATEETRVTLPKRPFSNPVARAVLEQRQRLAVAPTEWPKAARAFEAMTLAPDRFYEKPGDYLLMRSAFWQVAGSRGENLGKTVDAFWTLALQIEDASLATAKTALDAARDALKEALARGAAESEIARLVDQLRQAVGSYLQALAQSGERPGRPAENAGRISAEDLDERLSALRDLAGNGARGAAQDALDELSALLENLRFSSANGQPTRGKGEGAAAAEAAAALLGRQRDLADRAYARAGESGAGRDLAAEQRALREELRQLMQKAAGNPQAGAALDRAGRAMDEAGEALGAENFDAAQTAMEEAVKQLREGAGALARGDAASGRGAAGGMRDPLGRPVGPDAGEAVDLPETIDAERARQLREELRRRLSEGGRSEEEIRYLERLLERF